MSYRIVFTHDLVCYCKQIIDLLKLRRIALHLRSIEIPTAQRGHELGRFLTDVGDVLIVQILQLLIELSERRADFHLHLTRHAKVARCLELLNLSPQVIHGIGEIQYLLDVIVCGTEEVYRFEESVALADLVAHLLNGLLHSFGRTNLRHDEHVQRPVRVIGDDGFGGQLFGRDEIDRDFLTVIIEVGVLRVQHSLRVLELVTQAHHAGNGDRVVRLELLQRGQVIPFYGQLTAGCWHRSGAVVVLRDIAGQGLRQR